MDRKSLEALGAAELRQLIADAAEVLAARAGAAPAQSSQPAKDPASGSLFTFGAVGSGQPSGSFNPFASGAGTGLFSSASTSTGAKLFTGKVAGLFSGAAAGAEVPQATAALFSPPSRAGAAEEALKAGDGKGNGKTCVKASDTRHPQEEEEECEGGDFVPDEEVTLVQGWTPSMTLEVVSNVETGEEGEEELYSQRSKLYRFRDGEWKERGLGEARLLKDKTTGRVRFLLRQEKTGKVAANFLVIARQPYCDLRPNAESEKIWVWSALDSSDGDGIVEEKFALKFGTVELAAKFKEAFEDARQSNSKVLDLGEKAGNAEDVPDLR